MVRSECVRMTWGEVQLNFFTRHLDFTQGIRIFSKAFRFFHKTFRFFKALGFSKALGFFIRH